MQYNLILHSNVESDVSEAYNWYENKQSGLGERFLTELVFCYIKLESYPDFFSKKTKYYRRLILNHFPYIIAYEIKNESVFVYAVFHTSRSTREIAKRRNTI
jgi:toxin ParE1/3/4